MERCPILGGLALKDRIAIAELHVMSQESNEEHEEEKETEETENEETENKSEQKKGAKETEKKLDNAPEELTVPKQETARTQQLSTQGSAEQEVAANSTNLSSETKSVASDSGVGGNSLPISVTPAASAEKALSAERVQEVNGAVNVPSEKLSESGGTTPTLKIETKIPEPAIIKAAEPAPEINSTAVPVPKVEANIPEPAAIQAAEAYTLPQWEVGSATRQAQLENEPTPDASLATLHEDNLDDKRPPDIKMAFEDSQLEAEVYMPPELGTIASETDAELEELYLEGVELTENYAFDELWQIPEEMPVSYMLEIDAAEDLALPIGEAEYSISPPDNENAVIAPEISLPFEEVEQTILLLTERIEEFEAEEAETVHQLLDEIVHKVEETRVSMEDDLENHGNASETEEVEEELKGLFIQLFDYVGIEYSPELIESCAELVLREGMPELIVSIEQENDINTPQDEGTHEVIKQLLAAISSIKKAVLHAYHLGKSALRLYSQELLLDLSAARSMETANY